MQPRSAFIPRVLLLAVTILGLSHADAEPLGTAFTYQGRLQDGAGVANGIYHLRFSVYDAALTGNQVGPSVTVSNTVISNGFFVVTLDFGSGVFSNDARWLTIEVATNGGAFTLLNPRQNITPTPFAQYSATSGTLLGPVGSGQIGSNQVVKSINGLKDAVTLVVGDNLALITNSNANQLTLSSATFPNNLAEYSAPGLHSFTNATSTRLVAELWSAGGGGGGGGGSGHCNFQFFPGSGGGNGGAGGYCRAVIPLVPGAVYRVRIGSGGAGGAGGMNLGPNSPGSPGQPGQPGQDTTLEDANGAVLLRSIAGQGGEGGLGGICNIPPQGVGTNGAPGFGDLSAPVRRVGYSTGTIVPIGVIGGNGSASSAGALTGGAGGNGYALIQW